MNFSKRTVALAIAAAALLASTQAQAHARLVTSNPAADAKVAAPRQITLQFNEKVQPRFSGFELSRNGAPVPVKATTIRNTLVGTPATPLAPGLYKLKWHAATGDMHRMEGAYSFTVR